MSGRRDPWALPGPARLVAGLCAALQEDRIVTVRAPNDVEGLAAAVASRLNDEGQYKVVPVVPEAGGTVMDAIASAIGSETATPAGLATARELTDCAVVVVLPPGLAPEPSFHDFARLASRSARASGPVVMVVGDAAVQRSAGSPRDVRGVLGPLDTAAWLASLPMAQEGFEHRLVASVAMETAAWDLGALEAIASLPIASAVRPDHCIDLWSDDRLVAWRDVPCEWSAGRRDDWGGTSCEHPMWLAANRPDLLAKRVWRGQIAAMLPWIETRRLEVVASFRKRLVPDTSRCGPDVESLDWGPLGHQLRREAQWVVQMIEDHRCARNELAHGRALIWSDIARCLTGARRWQNGRDAVTS